MLVTRSCICGHCSSRGAFVADTRTRRVSLSLSLFGSRASLSLSFLFRKFFGGGFQLQVAQTRTKTKNAGRSRGHSRPTFSSDEIVRVNDDPLLSHSCNPSIRKVDKATRKLFPALHTSFRRRTALRTIARIPGLQTSLFHSRPRLSKCVTNRSVHTANSFTPYQDHSQPPPDPPWP